MAVQIWTRKAITVQLTLLKLPSIDIKMNFKAFLLLIAFVLTVCAVSPAIGGSCPDKPEKCAEICQSKGKPGGHCGGFKGILCFCTNK